MAQSPLIAKVWQDSDTPTKTSPTKVPSSAGKAAGGGKSSQKTRNRKKIQFTVSQQAIDRLHSLAGPKGNMSLIIEKMILSR